MGNNLDFSIGITADAEQAKTTLTGVIQDVSNLSNSMATFANGPTLTEIFGGFDPSLLMPNNEALESMAQTLREIKGLVADIVGNTGESAGEFELISDAVEESQDSVEEVAAEFCNMVLCVEEVADTLEEVPAKVDEVGTAVGQLKTAFAGIGEGFNEIASGIMTLGTNIMKLGLSQVEFESVRLGASMGWARDQSMEFAYGITATAERTGLAVESMTALHVGLAQIGIRFDQTTEAGRRQADTYAYLQDVIGMGAQATQQLAGTMHATGMSVDELTKTSTHLQKALGLTSDLTATMGTAAKAAMDAQAQFGTLVGSSSQDIANSILKMTGIYQKALGVTAAEAAQKATATFMKFTAEIESYEDLFLGLADSFTPMQRALLETGQVSMSELDRLMRVGQKGGDEFAKEVLRLRDSLGPQMGDRLMRQVMRDADEATKLFLTQQKVRESGDRKAIERMEQEIAAREQAKKEQEEFNHVINEMRKSAVAAYDIFKSLIGVIAEDTKLEFAEGVRQGLEKLQVYARQAIVVFKEFVKFFKGDDSAIEGYGDSIKYIAGAVRDFFSAGEDGESRFVKLIAGAVAFGGALASVVSAASTLGGVFVPLVTIGGGLWKVFKGLGGVFTGGKGLVKGIGKAGGGVKGFAKILGKIALPIAIAIAAFDGIVHAVKGVGAVLSDPSKSGIDKFKGVVMAVLGGVWEAIDSFFLGLPGMFVRGFTGSATEAETESSRAFGEVIGKIIGYGQVVLVGALAAYWDYLKWFWGTAVPAVIMAQFTPEFWWGLLSGLQNVGEHIIAFFKGVGGGILEAFGFPAESIGPMFNIGFLKIQKGVHGFVNELSDTFMNLISNFKVMFNDIGGFIDKLWSGVVSTAETALFKLVAKAVETLIGMVRDNPAIAKFFGVGDEEVQWLMKTEAQFHRSANLAKSGHEQKLKDIDAETEKKRQQIQDEQNAREDATKAWAAGYDSQIEAEQKKMDKIAAGRLAVDDKEAKRARDETAKKIRDAKRVSAIKEAETKAQCLDDDAHREAAFWYENPEERSKAGAGGAPGPRAPVKGATVTPTQAATSAGGAATTTAAMVEAVKTQTTGAVAKDGPVGPAGVSARARLPDIIVNIDPGLNNIAATLARELDFKWGDQASQGWD